jgi:hypothetical protein
LETDFNKPKNDDEALTEKEHDNDLINVRAIITCSHCGTKKTFINKFSQNSMEQMIVSLKVFDWLTCDKCGELLKLDLNFII